MDVRRLLTARDGAAAALAGGYSRSAAKERKWLDSQLINKVEGVNNNHSVGVGLIELKRKGVVDYEGKPIRRVWLTWRPLF